jgi:hypothetical protein
MAWNREHAIARTFTRCAEFLAQAVGVVGESSTPG